MSQKLYNEKPTLGATRQQAIIWAHVDLGGCLHMVSLCYELIWFAPVSRCMVWSLLCLWKTQTPEAKASVVMILAFTYPHKDDSTANMFCRLVAQPPTPLAWQVWCKDLQATEGGHARYLLRCPIGPIQESEGSGVHCIIWHIRLERIHTFIWF